MIYKSYTSQAKYFSATTLRDIGVANNYNPHIIEDTPYRATVHIVAK